MPDRHKVKEKDKDKEKNGILKRKRTQSASENHPPSKKSRQSNEKGNKHSKINSAQGRFRKKKGKVRVRRRKTTEMRHKLRDYIERALVDSPTLPPIGHLFKKTDASGTPRASLVEVLRTLQLSTKVKNTHFLKEAQWMSITNITSLFAIEEDEIGAGLFLKYRPVYNKEACTVYVDNLPEGCNHEKLERIAVRFGNIAEMKIIKKPPRLVRKKRYRKIPGNSHKKYYERLKEKDKKRKRVTIKNEFDNVGSRPRPYGFIRFTCEEAADAMIKYFKVNDMSERYEGKNPETVTRSNGFINLYLPHLMKEIRILQYRRKRRTRYQFFRLAFLRDRFRTLIRLEQKCWRKKPGEEGYRPRRRTWYRGFRFRSATVPRYSRGPKVKIVEPIPDSHPIPDPHPVQNPLPAPVAEPEPPDELSWEEQPTTSTSQASNPRKRKSSQLENNRTRRQSESAKRKSFEFKKKEAGKDGKKHSGKNSKKDDETQKKKKKKRKRKKKSRKSKAYIKGGSVANYFEQTQVLSLERHNQLATEYKALVAQEKQKAIEQ